ncbi:MAG: sigma-70 family RNA polymerase sigma factor [Nitrospirota bacterium]|nr:sigma-70 family RNA polymerase sigma factor [Nitrospirota bacterium]
MKEEKKIITDEDYKFVSLCKKGDVDAFEVLVKKHQKKMLNIAYRMIGSYEEACEIVQDSFVSAYKAIRDFEGKAKFSTWLYTIVMNLSKNRLKQLKTQLYHEQVSTDDPVLTDDGNIKAESVSNEPSILEQLEKKEFQQKVQGCINSLDDEFKDVLILRDIQGFSYDEISKMLKIAEGTVKSRLFRSREALKICLKKVIGDL